MEEIVLEVQADEDSGWLIASWDAPDGAGGINTQAENLRDLEREVSEAVACHFEESVRPRLSAITRSTSTPQQPYRPR